MRLTHFKQVGQNSHPVDHPCGWIWAFAEVYNMFALVLSLAEGLSGSFLLPHCFCSCLPTNTGVCLSCRDFWHLSYGYITGIFIKIICIKTHYFCEIDFKNTPTTLPPPLFVFWLNHQIFFCCDLHYKGKVGWGWCRNGVSVKKEREEIS